MQLFGCVNQEFFLLCNQLSIKVLTSLVPLLTPPFTALSVSLHTSCVAAQHLSSTGRFIQLLSSREGSLDACVYKTVLAQTKAKGLPKTLASVSGRALAEIERNSW